MIQIFLAHGTDERTDQPKVVQEVLADLKRQKIEFLDLKNLLFSGIFLSGFGGYPPPPLTDHFFAQKNLGGRGGTPPLMDKIR